MMIKPDFKAMTSAEAEAWLESIGEAKFRAKQVRSWIFEKGISSFDGMTNISKELREILNENAKITELIEINRQESTDGTLKFLFKGDDSHTFESVWIPDEKWRTLCVSTQVGCKMGCKFCLTGAHGYVRDLSAGEIIDQLVAVRKLVPDNRVTNIVLMGMGEPLDNYANVLQALKVWTEQGIGLIGARKVTLSTSGVAPMIERLAIDFPKIKLAVSLNAADDDTRSALLPINNKYPIARLFAALKKWPLPQGRLITLEYVLIKDVNDSDEDARKLAELTKGQRCKINLIPYNPIPSLPYERPTEERARQFMRLASSNGTMVFPRHSRGADILAACGQLRENVDILREGVGTCSQKLKT